MINTADWNASNVEGVGRVYANGENKYPSVTTVLQVVGDNTILDAWREKVGVDFADAYTLEAANIGTAMHDDYEKYLAGKPLKETLNKEERQARKMFKFSLITFKKLFKEAIIQEVMVISHIYKIAGRFDLIALGKDGKKYLVDFKNTKRDKKVDDIESYKLQLAFYHRMLKETLPEHEIDEHIVFMVNRDGFTKVFRFGVDDVKDEDLHKIRQTFLDKFGI